MHPKNEIMPQFNPARGKSIHIVIAMPPRRGGGMVARRVQINIVWTRGIAVVAVFWPPAAFFGKENCQNAVKNAPQNEVIPEFLPRSRESDTYSNHYAGSRRRLKQMENCDALHWGSALTSRGFSSSEKRVWNSASKARRRRNSGDEFGVELGINCTNTHQQWTENFKRPPMAASFHEMERRNKTPGLSQAPLSSAGAITLFLTDQRGIFFPRLSIGSSYIPHGDALYRSDGIAVMMHTVAANSAPCVRGETTQKAHFSQIFPPKFDSRRIFFFGDHTKFEPKRLLPNKAILSSGRRHEDRSALPFIQLAKINHLLLNLWNVWNTPSLAISELEFKMNSGTNGLFPPLSHEAPNVPRATKLTCWLIAQTHSYYDPEWWNPTRFWLQISRPEPCMKNLLSNSISSRPESFVLSFREGPTTKDRNSNRTNISLLLK
ncbi:hypothetical protein C8R43DRAFT_960800 [Mycena crocata]|nr:hypothetical protein C8R43DRAFT_960800 [Mycena crocata]